MWTILLCFSVESAFRLEGLYWLESVHQLLYGYSAERLDLLVRLVWVLAPMHSGVAEVIALALGLPFAPALVVLYGIPVLQLDPAMSFGSKLTCGLTWMLGLALMFAQPLVLPIILTVLSVPVLFDY